MRSEVQLTKEQEERRERGLRILARMIARAHLAALRERDATTKARRDRLVPPTATRGGQEADHGR